MGSEPARRPSIRSSRAVAGVVFALLGTAFLLDDLGVWRFELVLIWPISLIAIGVSVLLGRAQREQVDQTRRSRLAVAEERLRIARDLHDIVAHGVSLMTIQIAAARRVGRTKPDAAEEALLHAEEAGRRSLAELRDLVSVLRSADASLGAVDDRGGSRGPGTDRGATNGPRDDGAPLTPLPGLDDIEPLVAQFESAGLRLRYAPYLGDHAIIGPRLGLAAYRIVQEALTNVLRHAGPGTQTTVVVGSDGADLTITVTDDGDGAAPAGVASGRHGLVGMRERAVAVGGQLRAGRHPNRPGWQVEAVLPLNGGR